MKELEMLTKRLIGFKTVTGNNSECARLLDFVEGYLKPSGALIHRHNKNGFPSLVAATIPGKHFKLMFVGHIDVVPAEESQFEAVVKGGKLYGRGAIDMKSADAAMILLLKSLAKSGVSLGIMLTSDEEIGGENGVKPLVESEGYSCDFFIAPDGGSNFKLVAKEKGTLWLEIKAHGKACHGSKPWEGVNAIEVLIDKLARIKKLFPKDNKEKWVNTVNIGMIKGGEAPNKVPDEATAVIDIRWTEDGEGLLKKVGEIAECKILQFGQLFSTEPEHAEMKRLRKVMEGVLKRKVEVTFSHGASDARFFAGMPGAIFLPEGEGADRKSVV